jgi:tetratricopeptide (TPR) repeat protein
MLPSLDDILNGTTITSYSMGPVPPEDFAQDFGFPLDLIKVTQGKPLFSAAEAAHVIETAQAENVDTNEYISGKYKLGGDWLTNLPKTREWFNERLESTFFPLLTHLFPEIVSSPSVLRAHSVSLLKYNSSHPRTDVHVDNGILAMTLAMTPKDEYSGGGTFFEHFDEVLPMNVGQGTFRPGSVRHGGHRVTKGTRYILGAFLLLEDRVEHVRRLKNRGSELRRKGDLVGAARHFEWALAISPKCVTCLKDWAEILLAGKDFIAAEKKIREALALLEDKDSDALFTLGLLLSEQGKDDESIAAYQKSVALNAEDVELCYNLGIKLGAKGDHRAEMEMYARATRVDPKYGGAWLNWGTSLAESGNMDDVSYTLLNCLLRCSSCLI